MAKPLKSPDDRLIDALNKAYQALPDALPFSGAGALFPAKDADVAQRAIEAGFISKQVIERPGSGRSAKAKPVESATLTEKGIRKVLDAESPKSALEALLPVVQSMGRASSPSPEAFRTTVQAAGAACVTAVQEAFATMQREVLKALAPATSPGADTGAVLSVLQSTLERVRQPTTPAFPKPGAISPPADDATLENDIVSMVDAAAAKTTVGCQFDELMQALRSRHPNLSIGRFHDTLRKLRAAGRIRLTGWPKMPDDMPEPELALFISSKVMYYAQPTR